MRNAPKGKSLKNKKKARAPTPTPTGSKPSAKPSGKPSAKVTSSNTPLNTPIDVRREQAKVYREMRGGVIEATKGAKLVWVLGEVRRTIETDDLAKKLTDLQALAQGKK